MSRGPDSPFRFAVSDLLAETGRRRLERIDAPVAWSLEMSAPAPGGLLSAEAALESAHGGIFVRATASVPYRSTCHRCLTEWDHEETIRVSELVGEGADYELDGDALDLEPVLRDALLGALPDSPTCRDDCRGLCAVCGADLNTDVCPGHDEEPDGPFAVLRDLLEP
ncbi:MAG TPA: DUF177 domain-containing protein [Acidimicrobiia bacterium]|nr:DUF177 domain-containing protein [Acidimicrobiia bacterium]